MRCFDQRFIAWGARYIDSPETNLVAKRDYQRVWKGCYLVKLCIYNRSSYFEHSQALCGTNKDNSVIMWMSAHTSSEKGGEQLTWHWQSISSVFFNIFVITANASRDWFLHTKLQFLERHKKKSLCRITRLKARHIHTNNWTTRCYIWVVFNL